MASHLQWDKAFFNRFPDISYADRADVSILVQPRDSFLDNLCDSNRLTDCLSHGFQNNLFNLPILEEGRGVGDIVADKPLGGDSDLVLGDGRLGPRPLHPLVPVHLGPWAPAAARRPAGTGGEGDWFWGICEGAARGGAVVVREGLKP